MYTPVDDFFHRTCELARSEDAARKLERDFDDLVTCAMRLSDDELAHAQGVHAVRRELAKANAQ